MIFKVIIICFLLLFLIGLGWWLFFRKKKSSHRPFPPNWSQPALHQGFENQRSKSNVGIHEFVHLLDKADGATDGVPEVLMQRQYAIPWLKRMHEEIQEILEGDSDINPYAATDEAEFLSVVSEYFFNQPDSLEKHHPELFELLEKIYRQEFS